MSIQFTPSSRARWIAAIDSSSSCGPQPNSQPPPPIAQAPKPTRVISRPVAPSWVVLSCVRCMASSFARSARVTGTARPSRASTTVARVCDIPSTITHGGGAVVMASRQPDYRLARNPGLQRALLDRHAGRLQASTTRQLRVAIRP